MLLLGPTRSNLFVKCQEKIGDINLWFVNSKLGIIIEVNLLLMGVAQGVLEIMLWYFWISFILNNMISKSPTQTVVHMTQVCI